MTVRNAVKICRTLPLKPKEILCFVVDGCVPGTLQQTYGVQRAVASGRVWYVAFLHGDHQCYATASPQSLCQGLLSQPGDSRERFRHSRGVKE